MSYQAYDVNGFVGDLASNGGWNDFVQWASAQRGEIAAFVTDGYTLDLEALIAELSRRSSGNASVDSVRANLLSLAKRATDMLIASSEGDRSE